MRDTVVDVLVYKSISMKTQLQSADDVILGIAYSKSDWAARFMQQVMNRVAVLYQTLRLHCEGMLFMP